MSTTDSISSFYKKDGSEHDRLAHGIGQLEAARTLELLSRCLPATPGVVYDVGGATGYYARWLVEKGYAVHLLDLVQSHVEAALQHCPGLASANVGDARKLPWPDQSADAVLLMGPLYHLSDRNNRVQVLIEARRVLRPGGVLFGVTIPRWASTLIGMIQGWVFDDAYASMVQGEINSGQHERPDSWPQLFVNGFFHSMADVRREATEAGFEVQQCLAIEGPAWMAQEFESSWKDSLKRKRILELARLAEQDAEIIGASPHVAIVARGAKKLA